MPGSLLKPAQALIGDLVLLTALIQKAQERRPTHTLQPEGGAMPNDRREVYAILDGLRCTRQLSPTTRTYLNQ